MQSFIYQLTVVSEIRNLKFEICCAMQSLEHCCRYRCVFHIKTTSQ